MGKNELMEKISKIRLTKKEKILAEYFLDESTNIYLMTSTEIATKLNISDTSVIRFVKHLGYKNFKDFRNSGQNNIKNYLNKTDIFIEKVNILQKNSIEEIFLENINNDVKFFFNEKSIKRIKEICSLIMTKQSKYIVGFKSSAGLSNFFGVRLGFMLKNVQVFNEDNTLVVNAITDIKKDDVLIMFDYPMYSKTSKISTAPTVEDADIVYKLKMNAISLFNSLISSQICIEFILSYISKTLSDEYKDRFSKIKEKQP